MEKREAIAHAVTALVVLACWCVLGVVRGIEPNAVPASPLDRVLTAILMSRWVDGLLGLAAAVQLGLGAVRWRRAVRSRRARPGGAYG
jgi:hypothetical protein